jgi:hypothetical protein
VFPNAIVENVLSPNVIENMCFRDFENIFSCLIDNINPGVLGSGKYTQEISIRMKRSRKMINTELCNIINSEKNINNL